MIILGSLNHFQQSILGSVWIGIMDIFKLEHRKDNEDKIFFINHFWVPPKFDLLRYPAVEAGVLSQSGARIYFRSTEADSIRVIFPILFPLSFCHYPII